MSKLELVTMIYNQLLECPFEDLNMVFDLAREEIKKTNPEAFERLKEFMDVAEKVVINTRKEEAIN